MQKIFKKDKVRVIYGKYKGQVGSVLKIFPKERKLIVEGVNKVKFCKKNQNSEKEIAEKEVPIDISKVALVDVKTQSKIKVGFMFNKDGNKIRIDKITKKEIPIKK